MKKETLFFIILCFMPLIGCKNNDTEIIQKIVDKQNESCPFYTDEYTRFDSCAYHKGNNSIYYYYTLLNISIEPDSIKTLRENMTKATTALIKKSDKLKPFKYRNMTFDYFYSSENAKPLFNVRVTPDIYNED